LHENITLRTEKEKRKENNSSTHQVTVWWQNGNLYLYEIGMEDMFLSSNLGKKFLLLFLWHSSTSSAAHQLKKLNFTNTEK